MLLLLVLLFVPAARKQSITFRADCNEDARACVNASSVIWSIEL